MYLRGVWLKACNGDLVGGETRCQLGLLVGVALKVLLVNDFAAAVACLLDHEGRGHALALLAQALTLSVAHACHHLGCYRVTSEEKERNERILWLSWLNAVPFMSTTVNSRSLRGKTQFFPLLCEKIKI